LSSIYHDDIDPLAVPINPNKLTPASRRALRRIQFGLAIVVVFCAFGFWLIANQEQQLCNESHRRYDTLQAVLYTSTRPTQLAKSRLTPDQFKAYKRNLRDYRARLVKQLGPNPSC